MKKHYSGETAKLLREIRDKLIKCHGRGSRVSNDARVGAEWMKMKDPMKI